MDSKYLMSLMAAASSALAVPVGSIGVDTFSNPAISCDWSGAAYIPADIVGDIQTSKLNVTDVVTQCANVCNIVFASGNPDITGEGVLISSFIQTALACIFGVLFPALIWLITLTSHQKLIRTIPLLRKIQVSVFEINAFFTISIIVAAIVLHHQTPSILEVTFMSSLFTLQAVILIGMLWGQYGDSLMGTNSTSKVGWAWNVYYIAIGIILLITSSIINPPDSTLLVYKSLAKECQNQDHFSSISSYLSPSAIGTSALKCLGVGLAIGFGLSILGCLLAVPFTKLYTWIKSIIPEFVKKHGVKIIITIILSFYVSVIVADAIVLNEYREVLKKMGEDLAQIGGWGYGQTTAILLWGPFAWTVVKATIQHWRSPVPAEQPEADAEAPALAPLQELESIPPPYTPAKGHPAEVAP